MDDQYSSFWKKMKKDPVKPWIGIKWILYYQKPVSLRFQEKQRQSAKGGNIVEHIFMKASVYKGYKQD